MSLSHTFVLRKDLRFERLGPKDVAGSSGATIDSYGGMKTPVPPHRNEGEPTLLALDGRFLKGCLLELHRPPGLQRFDLLFRQAGALADDFYRHVKVFEVLCQLQLILLHALFHSFLQALLHPLLHGILDLILYVALCGHIVDVFNSFSGCKFRDFTRFKQ